MWPSPKIIITVNNPLKFMMFWFAYSADFKAITFNLFFIHFNYSTSKKRDEQDWVGFYFNN